MKVLSLFDGMSCGQIAFKELGIEVEKYYAYEIDKYAIQATQHNFPATEQCGDVFKADFTKYNDIDWLIGGSPCFAAGTIVKTENGFKEIQDIIVGDKVLTHTGNYKKVTKVMTKISDKYCILSGENMEDIICTPNHRFYTKQMVRVWDNQSRASKRTLSNNFSWTPVDKFVCIKNDSQTIKEQTYISCISDNIKLIPKYNGCNVNVNQSAKKNRCSLDLSNADFWYIVGRYIGDGWLKYKYKKNGKKLSGVIICCGKHEINELESKVKLSGFNYSITEERTTYRVTITNVELANFLLQFGIGAKNKHLNANIFNLPNEQLDSFIKGYLDADGHYGDNTITASTISKELAYGIKYIVNKLYKKPCSIKKSTRNDMILGRKVNTSEIYTLNFPTNDNNQKHYFVEDNIILTSYKKIETISKPLQVFNLSVEDDESYTANGIVVHNCTYWSIAQKNNRETEASGLGWELFSQYVRALHEAKPKCFLYENNKSMSKQIRASINQAFGFEANGINSALVSAQNRQRLYWVGIRQDDGTYAKANIEQPKDRMILLKDILESDIAINGDANTINEPIRIPEYSIENKSRPVEALYVNHAGTGAGSLEKRLFSDNPNKQQNDLIAEPIREGKLKSYINQVYEVKDGKITINGKQYPIKLPDGYYIIRKLTVKECMRLQTVPDWYVFSCISNSQAYKCLGNGWTVEVIKHLIHSALTNKPKEEQKQLSMFDLLGEQAQ